MFFYNSNLSQVIFAIDTWGAVICSLGHGRKHMLTILPTIWRPDFSGRSRVSRKVHSTPLLLGQGVVKNTLGEKRLRVKDSPHEAIFGAMTGLLSS